MEVCGVASALGTVLDCVYSLCLDPSWSLISLELNANQELLWIMYLLQEGHYPAWVSAWLLPVSSEGASCVWRPTCWGRFEGWHTVGALQSLCLLENPSVFERRTRLIPCKPKSISSPFLTHSHLLCVMLLSLIFVLDFWMSIKHLFIAVLRIEPRASHVLAKCSTYPWTMPP